MRIAMVLVMITGLWVSVTCSHAGYIRILSDGTITNVPGTSDLMVVIRTTEKPDRSTYDSLINSCAARYDLAPSLIKAVIEAESNFDPLALSPKGAMGLMQLMPQTAEMLEVRDAYSPRENVDAGSRYLSELIDMFGGRLDLALAAYNAGPTVVESIQRIPLNRETPSYVKKVLKVYVAGGGILPEEKEEKDIEQREMPKPQNPRGVVFLCKDEEGRTVITNIPVLRGD